MNNEQDIRTQNDLEFRKIAFRVLKQAGFEPYSSEKKFLQPSSQQNLMKKGDNVYCVETFYSRREVFTSRAILTAGENLIRQTQKQNWLPLIVVGGMLAPALHSDLLGKSIRTVILDIGNLLYIAWESRELYDELVAQLPYSVGGLRHREPDYLPIPDWDGGSVAGQSWQSDTISPLPKEPVEAECCTVLEIDTYCDPLIFAVADTGETKVYRQPVVRVGRDVSNDYSVAGVKQVSRRHATFSRMDNIWFIRDNGSQNGTYLNGKRLEPERDYPLTIHDEISFAKKITVIFGKWMRPELPRENSLENLPAFPDGGPTVLPKPEQGSGYDPNGLLILGRPGTGKSSSVLTVAFEMLQQECKGLRREIRDWQGGKQSNSAAYEKLCTRTLMRLFAEDLTLWKEQARSNDDLFRFDLICKIKRDNHKDFWEMAERYFNSKYIIFEFKNYAGKVTQKEVYTTVRYLYTKAMRGVAVIISPNGMDENAGKAIRGVLRDEGKLVLSLTNDELVHMLQMKEDGEDPADYLSDKLDELLIDLEK